MACDVRKCSHTAARLEGAHASAADVSSHRRRVSMRMNFSSNSLRSLSLRPSARW